MQTNLKKAKDPFLDIQALHHKNFFEELAKKLNIRSKEDWYSIKPSAFNTKEGLEIIKSYGTLTYFSTALYKALRNIYPQLHWQKKKFKNKEDDSVVFWRSLENQRIFFESLEKTLNINKLNDWHNIKISAFVQQGGSSLLKYYQGNIGLALQSIYPNHKWKMWKFGDVPIEFWNNEQNCRDFLNDIEFENPEDLYNLTPEIIIKKGGKGLLEKYGGSISKLILSIFPEKSLHPYRFQNSKEYWDLLENQRKFIEYVQKHHKISNQEHWYNISKGDLFELGGYFVFELYENSLYHLLCSVLPEFYWNSWKFKETPHGYWSDLNNQRVALEAIGQSMNINVLEDWYKVSQNTLVQTKAFPILQIYGKSRFKMFSTVYSERKWLAWKFEGAHLSVEFWKDKENIREFILELLSNQNISDIKGFYGVSKEDIFQNGGSALLQLYNQSLFDIATAAFPEIKWEKWEFDDEHLTLEYWRDPKVQREFLDSAMQKLSLTKLDDWYEKSNKDISLLKGEGLLRVFDYSLPRILSAVYKEHEWLLWRFQHAKVPTGYWEDPQNVKLYLDWLASRMGIQMKENKFKIDSTTNAEDFTGWYSVGKSHFTETGGTSVLQMYGGLNHLLTTFYPSYPWDFSEQIRSLTSKGQYRAFKVLRDLLPVSIDIHVNYSHPTIKFADSNLSIELDIYIPSLNLALEYQGEGHYKKRMNNNLEEIKARDKEKAKLCAKAGITLVEIPYWWDNTKEGLIKYILTANQDFLYLFE